MKKHSYPMGNIGSVSLLMTFIILCLVVFVTLALSSAASQFQYSQKLAASHAAYYEASNSATDTLKEIDEILHAVHAEVSGTIPSSADFSEAYYEAALFQLSQLQNIAIEMDFTGEEPVIIYEVPVSESQKLQVALALNPVVPISKKNTVPDSSKAEGGADTAMPGKQTAAKAGGYYRVTAWQTLPSSQWKADNQLKLLNPD